MLHNGFMKHASAGTNTNLTAILYWIYMKKASKTQSEAAELGCIKENPHCWRPLQSRKYMESTQDLESTYVFGD
jgi:hypothetical protein